MTAISHNIHIQVFDAYKSDVSSRKVRSLIRRALAEALPGSPTQLSVIIADDETVRTLNKYHRGLDETTDVLSFSFQHQGGYYGDGPKPSEWTQDTEFVLPPGETEGIGEIVISYPQTVRQAEAQNKAPQDELAFLLAHGILHLLGHDHEEPEERTVMEAEQTKLLTAMLKRR